VPKQHYKLFETYPRAAYDPASEPIFLKRDNNSQHGVIAEEQEENNPRYDHYVIIKFLADDKGEGSWFLTGAYK
ncbi:MAG: hypothetical protein LBD96_10975, partial [Treponema sp.]|nr:hypothetical protein [Treponema sp.]